MSKQPLVQDSQARRRMVTLAVIVLLVIIAGQSWACASRPPSTLGLHSGRLAPCPDRPNCVHSQEDGPAAIAPIPYPGDPATTRTRLLAALTAMPRTRIRVNEPNYLWVECRTLVFRFVDDLECYLDDEARLIHLRSASRLGYSDMGVNRRRVEALRQKLGSPQ